MTYLKLAICLLVFFVYSTKTLAASGQLLPIKIELNDKAKLQRGARFFMNYCSGCHSLRYLRYDRMAKDLGLTTFDGALDEKLLLNNLIFTRAKIHDPIQISMRVQDARQWFGAVPPDLTLKARERGASWLYTFLKSFYEDSSRPFGSNNLLVPEVGMPNVLQPLIGQVVLTLELAAETQVRETSLISARPGKMSEPQFNSALEDLISFLVYAAEPIKVIRYRIGSLVCAFLLIFLVFVYKLKETYWRNLH